MTLKLRAGPEVCPVGFRKVGSRLAGTLLLLCPGLAAAGVNAWTGNGPPGRDVRAVAVAPSDPLTVYVGTEKGGVFRSRDGGKTWRQAGLGGEIVRVLTVSPASASVVYAGVYFNRGLFRSTDGGATWSFSGLDGLNVVAISVNPSSPSTVYASYYESPFGDAAGGLARSQDSGASWTTILSTTGFGGPIAINPALPSTIYTTLTTQFGGAVYKTLDGGATWHSVFAGGATILSRPSELALDPSTPDTLYTNLESFLPPARPEKPADELGIYRTTDGGAHWTQVHDSSVAGDFFVHPASHILYVLGYSHIWRSSDQGVTFTLSFAGLPARQVESLASGAPGVFYSALGPGGVFRSVNSGDRWSAVNNGLTASEVSAVNADPGIPGRLYAGSSGVGVFEGLAGGAWWHEVTAGLAGAEILSIALDPANPSRVFVGTRDGIYRSARPGFLLQWDAVHSGAIAAIAIDPSTPSTIYAGMVIGTGPYQGVWKSTDGGDNWVDLQTPEARSLAIDPVSPSTIYAGGPNLFAFPRIPTIRKSLDGGATWSDASSGIGDGDVFALGIDPSNHTTVYAGTDRGVYKSVDSGGVWAPVNTGVGDTTSVLALAVDPATPGTVYAGTAGGGVLRTVNGGASWAPFNAGLTGLVVRALAIDATGTSLYAGTGSDGVFSYSIRSDPSASRFVPSSGPASGGTAVTISGSGFQPGATVQIGGVAAADVVVVDSSTITARTPVLPAGGLYAVLVSNPGTPGRPLDGGWLADFGDVPAEYLFHDAIERLFRAAVTRGCGNGNFCPADPLTRAQVAVFTLRTVRGPAYRPPAATGAVFQDVSSGTPLADWIEDSYAQGLTTRCVFSPPRFCPDNRVLRAEFTQNLWFAEHFVTFPGGAGGVFFGDVPASLPNAAYIEALFKEGFVGGCSGGNFCPNASVTRGEAAALLARVFSLP